MSAIDRIPSWAKKMGIPAALTAASLLVGFEAGRRYESKDPQPAVGFVAEQTRQDVGKVLQPDTGDVDRFMRPDSGSNFQQQLWGDILRAAVEERQKRGIIAGDSEATLKRGIIAGDKEGPQGGREQKGGSTPKTSTTFGAGTVQRVVSLPE